MNFSTCFDFINKSLQCKNKFCFNGMLTHNTKVREGLIQTVCGLVSTFAVGAYGVSFAVNGLAESRGVACNNSIKRLSLIRLKLDTLERGLVVCV